MQVKRFEVASMNDAMIKIKKDLGPDAVILSARKIKSGKQDVFEVMAARDEEPPVVPTRLRENDLKPKVRPVDASSDVLDAFRGELRDIKSAVEALQRQSMLGRELAEMKETINSFFDVLGMRKGRAPQDLNSTLYLHLTASGFSKATACRIVDAVNQMAAMPQGLSEEEALTLTARHIGESLPASKEGVSEKRIKMFIGPTGVGKTTTLAKLAARYSIMKKRNVGLITTDNFRIAAAEQLGTYAKIMGLRMEKASTRESFEKAVKSFSDKDIILVDTPGRAHPDDGYLNQLEGILPAGEVETSLLINATGSEDHLENIVSAYSRFRVSSLIVTKIDESRRFGMLYDIISKTNRPVTYLTCGQNVPQDIEEVTPARMASLMLRCEAH
ncbi:MAG TPA: flagellar biosynthesis protein FlhF [Smithellaceae bacterium]|nr:flagellar biosynthesis protein FlhF [Smithellaceae bacterium]